MGKATGHRPAAGSGPAAATAGDVLGRGRRERQVLLPPTGARGEALTRQVREAEEAAQVARVLLNTTADGTDERTRADGQMAVAAAAVEEAKATLAAASKVMLLRAPAEPDLEEIRRASAKDPDGLKEAERSFGLVPAIDERQLELRLVALCLVQPQMTVDQVEQVRATWAAADWHTLRQAANEIAGTAHVEFLGN
jgi:hypothetical protein